jgi:hypothetical protein
MKVVRKKIKVVQPGEEENPNPNKNEEFDILDKKPKKGKKPTRMQVSVDNFRNLYYRSHPENNKRSIQPFLQQWRCRVCSLEEVGGWTTRIRGTQSIGHTG